MYNTIIDKHYLGIATIFDYEQPLQKMLSGIHLQEDARKGKKILVDLALKVGINKYRFVEYNITDEGTIITTNFLYVIPNNSIIKLANSFIKQKKESLKYSVLSSLVKKEILES